jgi:hypothetical protein
MSEASTPDEQSANEYYIPGASVSTDAGPVERVLTHLFRRRGRF